MWTRTELRYIGVQDFEPGTRSTRVEDLCFLVIWTNVVWCLGPTQVSVRVRGWVQTLDRVIA